MIILDSEVVTMKKMILVLLGFTPLAIGFQMNSWIMQNSVLPYGLIGLVFLALWVLFGYLTCAFEKTSLKSAVIANSPAFLILLLIVYQELILGQFWPNAFGVATQFYYFPLLNTVSSIGSVFYGSSPYNGVNSNKIK